ncbi:MAG: hypothetical protein AAGF78_06925 [Pseudomonadota bacterium]
MARLIVFLLMIANAAHANWCAREVTGLPETWKVSIAMEPPLPFVLATNANDLKSSGEFKPPEFRVLDEARFVAGREVPVKSLPVGRVSHPDGRTTFNLRSTLFEIRPEGTIHILAQAESGQWRQDPATGRIFHMHRGTLSEPRNGQLEKSELATDAIADNNGDIRTVFPRFDAALNAWFIVVDGRLLLRGPQDDEWTDVARVRTWRTLLKYWEVDRFHDEENGLLILKLDVNVAVFDVSGPQPEFLYQRLIFDGKIAQAGKGAVLVETYEPRRDVGRLERASVVRMLTRRGADLVPGAAISDREYRLQTYSFGGRNVFLDLGSDVLVIHEGGAALFDGRRVTDWSETVPDPGRYPWARIVHGEAYLSLHALYRWTGGIGLDPVLSPVGEAAHSATEGHGFTLFHTRGPGFVEDENGATYLLAPPRKDTKHIWSKALPYRTEVLAMFDEGLFLYAPCG